MNATPPGARSRFQTNPFFILGISTRADAMDVEREAAKLLAQLELGLEAAASFATPVGPAPRDRDLVRWALAEVRDPDKRAVHELWAGMPPDV
jgi:hypothetical protein